MVEIRHGYKMLVITPELKRGLGEHRRKCGDAITLGLKEIGWECVDQIHLLQDKVQLLIFVNIIRKNFRAAYNVGNCLPINGTQNWDIRLYVSMFHLADYWMDFYKMWDWGVLKIVGQIYF
jgi:hypothetical protein